jgi:hypothetical protein
VGKDYFHSWTARLMVCHICSIRHGRVAISQSMNDL